MLGEVAGKDIRTVVIALIKRAKKRPKELYKSLSWDRNLRSSSLCVGDQDRRRFLIFSKEPVERGSEENTNGLRRQYVPKGTDLSVHTQGNLNEVARQLNERPRETSQFKTTAEKSNALCRGFAWAIRSPVQFGRPMLSYLKPSADISSGR
jgi:IS30 family transposase